MKKTLNILAALILSALVQIVVATGSEAAGRLSPELEMLRAGETASVIVLLADQVDPYSVTKGVKGRSKGLRTGMLVRALKEKAGLSQMNIMKLVNAHKAAGKASRVRPLWIINAVALTADREVIDELALLPEVLEVYPDREIPLETPVLAAGPAEDNIGLINAPAMWDSGFTGQGVVVANVDSGVDYNHPDLAGSYRGGTNSWFDPYGQHATPFDSDGHGTGTMGVMVGGSASGKAIGVAPGAKWIAAKMFDDSGNATESGVHLCYEWILDPDGDPVTDDAPDVVNNSWGFAPSITYGNCVTDFEQVIAAMRAAGILPVFSAGNYGPDSGSDVSPANNAGALSVGATDNYDAPAYFSSRGPNSCRPTEIFPRMSAPGYGIRTSTISYGGTANYDSVYGTSFSAPHVSGAAALLLSASPGLTVDELETALVTGSVDLLPAGLDNTTGAGRLDVLAAFSALDLPVTPRVTLSGPVEGTQLWRKAYPTFTWSAALASGFELQFSNLADFSLYTPFTLLPGSPTTSYTPDKKAWRAIRRLGRYDATVYWRVKGTDMDGATIYSDIRSFTVVRSLPLP